MVTTYDIAKLTGLNQSTVSRVLSGFPNVRAETAKKVYSACRKLDYVPNASARALKTRKTFTLAIHMPYGNETVFADPFVPIFLSAVSREASARGYSVVISCVEADSAKSDLVHLVKSRRIDGAIITSPSQDDHGIRILIDENIPFVSGRHEVQKNENSVCVDIDNNYTGYISCKFLIGKGYRRIGLITETSASIVGRDFETGFIKALTEDKVQPNKKIIKHVPVTYDAGYRAATEILSEKILPDAIIANTALTVFGAVEAVKRSGKKVTVLGVDSPLLKSLYPELPRIQAPISELGCAMAGALIELLEKKVKKVIKPKMLYARIIDENGNIFYKDK